MAPGKAHLPEVEGHVSAVRDRGMRPRGGTSHRHPTVTSEPAGDKSQAGGRSVSYEPSVVALRT